MPTYDENGALLVNLTGGVAPVGAQYVVMALDGTLTNERVLTGTADQVIVTDGGAGGPATLSTPQDIATTSGVTFGTVTVPNAGWVGAGVGCAWRYDSATPDISTTVPVGFGTTDPGAPIDISGGGLTAIFGADLNAITRTNATTKYARLGLYHYTNAEEPVGMLFGISQITSNIVYIGGGTTQVNAATEVRIYTAETITTTTGTQRVTVDKNGAVGINDPTPSRRLQAVDDSASTNVIIPIARLESQVSGGAGAAGHGPSLELYGETTTTGDQSMASVAAVWSTATHASRRARVEFRAAYIGTDVLVGVVEAPTTASADGNARGIGAVDLQGTRGAAAQVASGDYAVMSGGSGNTGSGDYAVMAGGGGNTASNSYTVVGGGVNNTASGDAATVAGGGGNTASGDNAFAAGELATASHNDSFVWSSTAATASWGVSTFAARCHGGARFYSAAGVGTGVQLTAGGNAWAAISARAAKTNFRPVEDILSKFRRLPIYDYNLKSQADSVRHVGPVAEDFNEVFGFTEAAGYINTLDVGGVALAAIKALIERIEKMEEKLQ